MSTKAGKVFGGIVLAPFILIALGVAYCEANKAYWDHRVKELCEKDGGVTVFEKVEISKTDYPSLKFASNGDVILPSVSHAKSDDAFYSTFKVEYINKDGPEVMRFESTIIRASDKKILSKGVSYGRSGGDFPTGVMHPSSFLCNDIKDFRLDTEKQTFYIKGE